MGESAITLKTIAHDVCNPVSACKKFCESFALSGHLWRRFLAEVSPTFGASGYLSTILLGLSKIIALN